MAVMMAFFKKSVFCFYLTLIGFAGLSFAKEPEGKPFYATSELFDFSQPESLGLVFAKHTITNTVYKPSGDSDQYANGAVLIGFKGYLYAQWQSSNRDEDSADTWVAYSRALGGINWSSPLVLAPTLDNGMRTSGGWWTDGEILVAYVNVWPKELEPKAGYTEYRLSQDGVRWSEPKRVLANTGQPVDGVFEQDVHALPNGRIISAFHQPPGLKVAPYFTDDRLGIAGWTKGEMANLPFNKNTSREIEPSWFYRADGNPVMVFRDQASTFKKLASISRDNGKTWTKPTVTNFPDSRSKQCAGNLPDGTAYLVNNPSHNKTRIPLVISLSKNGREFNKAYLLRSGGADLQPMRFEGQYKRIGYSYPKAVVWQNALYVAYATNKEDVQVTRVPLESLVGTSTRR